MAVTRKWVIEFSGQELEIEYTGEDVQFDVCSNTFYSITPDELDDLATDFRNVAQDVRKLQER